MWWGPKEGLQACKTSREGFLEEEVSKVSPKKALLVFRTCLEYTGGVFTLWA